MNQCSGDMNNYCQWHKMADVRSVENRKGDFILNARLLFFVKTWYVSGIDYSACMYRPKMCFAEIVLHHLPGETSAFLTILYYLWMFICCSTGVSPWNRPWLKSTISRFDANSSWSIYEKVRVSRGPRHNDYFHCKFRSPWLQLNSVHS